MNKEMISKIYRHFGDEISKKIFSNRLLYSLTGDDRYIHEILKELPESKAFYDSVAKVKVSGGVIFGAGSWGKELYLIMKDYPWKCFVDSVPKADRFEELPIITYHDFIEGYEGEVVVISSRLYYQEMHKQLIEGGIPSENIINVGQILDEWSKKQYFDLELLNPEEEEEIFIDAGSLDGATSIEFTNWCRKSKKSSVYIFEPDKKSAGKCYEKLAGYPIECQIIRKGCWSEETSLRFQARGDGNSSFSPIGEEEVEVTAIDKELEGKKVTFIKMDIEGSELEALYGAKYTIINNRPKLAICVYHKPEDIWEIPNVILQYYPGYTLYIRHYSLTDSETVLYALP